MHVQLRAFINTVHKYNDYYTRMPQRINLVSLLKQIDRVLFIAATECTQSGT